MPADASPLPVPAPATDPELLRCCFTLNPQPMWICDGQTLGLLEVNEAALDLYGYTRPEFLTLTARDLRPPEEVPAFVQRVATAPPALTRSGPWRHRRKDGTVFLVDVATRRVDFAGQPAWLVLVIQVTAGKPAEAALPPRNHLAEAGEDVTDRRQAERQLRESLLFRREAERIGRVGAWKANPVTDELVWTEGVREIIEVPPDFPQPGLEAGLKFYDSESVPALKAAVAEALRSGAPFALEVGATTARGRRIWTEVRGIARIEDGGTAYVMGTFHDITERRRAEQLLAEKNQILEAALDDLRSSRNMLERIIESIQVRVFWKDTASRYLGCNLLFARDAGLPSPADVVGRDDRDLAWREFAEAYRADDRQVMTTRQPKRDIVEELRTAEGRVIWLNTSKTPLLRPDGSVAGILGTYEDITARRTLELARAESERRLANLMANLPGMVYRCDNHPDWPMSFVNEGCGPLTGYNPDVLMRNQPAYGDLIVPEDRQMVWDTVQAAVQQRQPFEMTYRLQTADRGQRWVWERGRGVHDEAGRLLFLEGFITDVTESRVAEESLRHQMEELRRWQEATLGRESRVLELKHEVNDLLRAHGQPARYPSVAAETDAASPSADAPAPRPGEPSAHEPPPAPISAEQSRLVLLSVVEDQKTAETALRESEARYRSLLETSFDWVWEIDASGVYTYASPRVQDLLGYLPTEVVGRSPFDFMSEEEARRVRALFAPLAASRAPIIALENTLRHRDGHPVVVETNGSPVTAPDGTFLGYRGMDRDITARRQAERTLRLRSAALEAAANAVVITDHAGSIQWTNRAFSIMTGWTFAEVCGRQLREVLGFDARSTSLFDTIWATLSSGQAWRGEITTRRKDGATRTKDMTITPLRDERGEITHFIAIKQDITDQKRLEAQFLQSQRMEAIGTLASGIAHDLNNILAPMLLVSGVLRDKLPEEGDQEILAMLQREARRGADIVRQLLTFSRGFAGERTTMQPRHLLKELLAMMRETFPREIDLQQQIAGDLWTIEADPTQIHQVLLNLCVNARDAMPGGGHLTLRAANVQVAADDDSLPPDRSAGPYVRLEVLDTGTGIPPEIQHRIFDPFFTTKAVGKGTGLGLSTVLGIVRNHGGYIKVYSEPGRGTAFRIHLPANPDSAAATPAPEAPAAVARGTGEVVLVVDDERNLRESLRLTLTRHGYKVLVATNGQDALNVFEQQGRRVDLVLTDLMMPVMNGVALVRALRTLAPRLPVVATSGLGETSHRTELASLGITEILMKPCEVPALLQAIRNALLPAAGS